MSRRNKHTGFRRILAVTAKADSAGVTEITGPANGTAMYISGKVTSGTDFSSVGSSYAEGCAESVRPAAESPVSVAEELGDLSKLTKKQLDLLRRSYARKNHPDLGNSQKLISANDRMSSANMLIDDAIRKIRTHQSSK